MGFHPFFPYIKETPLFFCKCICNYRTEAKVQTDHVHSSDWFPYHIYLLNIPCSLEASKSHIRLAVKGPWELVPQC